MLVYLSGPIDNSTKAIFEHCKSWRIASTKHLKDFEITTRDPLRGGIHPVVGQSLDSIPAPPASIVARDRMDIADSDLILVYWPEASKKRGIGTLMEIALGHDQGKPIILVDPGNIVAEHPWIQNCVTEIFPKLNLAWDSITEYWRCDDER